MEGCGIELWAEGAALGADGLGFWCGGGDSGLEFSAGAGGFVS